MEECESKEGGEDEGGRVSCALRQTDIAQRQMEKNERFRKRRMLHGLSEQQVD